MWGFTISCFDSGHQTGGKENKCENTPPTHQKKNLEGKGGVKRDQQGRGLKRERVSRCGKACRKRGSNRGKRDFIR